MHYANGREAKVGDHVVGKTYNQPDVVAGTLVSLTPGPDTCSAQVEWRRAVVLDDAETAQQAMGRVRTVLMRGQGEVEVTLRHDQQHGTVGHAVAIVLCRDYTHASNLLHAADAYHGIRDVKPCGTCGVVDEPGAGHVHASEQPAPVSP
jgi:hypothetical protein